MFKINVSNVLQVILSLRLTPFIFTKFETRFDGWYFTSFVHYFNYEFVLRISLAWWG